MRTLFSDRSEWNLFEDIISVLELLKKLLKL